MNNTENQKPQKEKTHSLHLKLEHEQFCQILILAHEENRTKSNMGERLIEEAMNARKNK